MPPENRSRRDFLKLTAAGVATTALANPASGTLLRVHQRTLVFSGIPTGAIHAC